MNLGQKLRVVLTSTQCMSTYQEPFLESSYQIVMFPEGYTSFFKPRFYSFLANAVSCLSFVVSVKTGILENMAILQRTHNVRSFL